MGYYPDWVTSDLQPENINFFLFDWIDFAFAIPDQYFNITLDDALLTRLVTAAHFNQKKVKLSVGGWGGSRYFSLAVATNQTRAIFVNNILLAFNFFDLDGIDIDWEYPGQQGDQGNHFNSNDTSNFCLFLQLLRHTLPPSAKITAAAQLFPFVGPDGNPIQDASQFANVLDWVLLMNYDVWGVTQIPGPNAPMYNACHNSSQPAANAVAAYNTWTSAGFPPSKLVLGLPSYGYVYGSNVTRLRTRSMSNVFESVLDFDSTLPSPDVKITNDGSGQVQFRSLVDSGVLVLVPDGDGSSYVGGGGFTREWDDCSETPFLWSPSVDQVVAYDDPNSLGMKSAFAKETGMLGVNLFDISGDTTDWSLMDAIWEAMDCPVP